MGNGSLESDNLDAKLVAPGRFRRSCQQTKLGLWRQAGQRQPRQAIVPARPACDVGQTGQPVVRDTRSAGTSTRLDRLVPEGLSMNRHHHFRRALKERVARQHSPRIARKAKIGSTPSNTLKGATIELSGSGGRRELVCAADAPPFGSTAAIVTDLPCVVVIFVQTAAGLNVRLSRVDKPVAGRVNCGT